MSLLLTRVDDRLIHGQVVVGWGQALHPTRIVLADDTIAEDTWEHDIYRAGVPEGIAVEFVTVAEAATRIEEWQASGDRTILLVGDVDGLMRLCRDCPGIRSVNLGGIHETGGRARRLPYLYLTDQELERLRSLGDQGIEVIAQDLPGARRVPVSEL